MVVVTNDDPTFLWWRNANPTGFILVTHNPPSGKYLTLHRVGGCANVNAESPANGDEWTVNYGKVLSANRSEIEEWAERSFGAVLNECAHCFKKS